jgi:hypothetical protein
MAATTFQKEQGLYQQHLMSSIDGTDVRTIGVCVQQEQQQ